MPALLKPLVAVVAVAVRPVVVIVVGMLVLIVYCCHHGHCLQAFEDSQVMNDMMSQPVVSTDTVDDDELRQELDDLLAVHADSNISSTPVRPSTDSFGKHKLLKIAWLPFMILVHLCVLCTS